MWSYVPPEGYIVVQAEPSNQVAEACMARGQAGAPSPDSGGRQLVALAVVSRSSGADKPEPTQFWIVGLAAPEHGSSKLVPIDCVAVPAIGTEPDGNSQATQRAMR